MDAVWTTIFSTAWSTAVLLFTDMLPVLAVLTGFAFVTYVIGVLLAVLRG